MVYEERPEYVLITFAALPVGAKSKARISNFGIILTKAERRDVFPVPAYPFRIKTGFSSTGFLKNLSIFRKNCSCPPVGEKGKFFLNKSEGVGRT